MTQSVILSIIIDIISVVVYGTFGFKCKEYGLSFRDFLGLILIATFSAIIIVLI